MILIVADMGKKLKISSTAYRVLLLLQKLNEKKLSIDELNYIFSEDPDIARFFSKDVILKYISTLRMAGYKIEKPAASDNYRYVLNKAPIQIEFSEEEIKALALLRNYAYGLQQNKYVKNYCSFIEKLKRYISNDQVTKLKEQFKLKQNDEIINKFKKYSDLIKKIEQYISENQRVEIKYNSLEENAEKLVVTKLQRIKYEKNSVNIIYYDLIAGQTGSVNIEDIINIKQLPSISGKGQILCPVIFKLKGRLAKIYRPYEREKLGELDLKTNEITVTAYSEDVDALLQRLLKYGENCELLYPRQFRNKMMNLIKNTLENYQVTEA